MEVDTGSSRSCIPEDTYRQSLGGHALQPSAIKLRSYSGELVPHLGEIRVPVSYSRNKEKMLKLLVVEGRRPALLGRDWMRDIKLNWSDICNVNATSEQPSLTGILSRYAHLFKLSDEGIKGFTAALKLKPEGRPVFQKARPVAYSLRNAVETELGRLENATIIRKLDPAGQTGEWASPTVNVQKTKGQNVAVRICGDYKRLNACIEDENYPLPTAQDLFAKLSHNGNGPKVYTILDLSGAFNQLKMNEESIPFLTINTFRGLYQMTRLSYGIKTAPSLFQATMDKILEGLENVLCYIDDILIIGKSGQDNLETLLKVMERLDKYNLRLSIHKKGHVTEPE
ncbi:Uncharacterised protein r2_g2439 [Pycnogonum litorale]